MIFLKRKKILAIFLFTVCVFYKFSIYNDYIINYLNELNKSEGAVLIISSQSDRTLTDAFKKNTSDSLSFCGAYVIHAIHNWYATNSFAFKLDQDDNLCLDKFNLSGFKTLTAFDFIYPFHFYF
jgi:hypothetical protein